MHKIKLLILIMLLASPAYAHKVSVFAYAEDGQLNIEGYFFDGRPAMDSRVEIYDNSGELLLIGQTDAEGIFQAADPGSRPLKISMNASMGHLAEFVLAAEEPVASEQNIPAAPERHGPKLSQVLCGLGYIFGIFGIFALIKSRKREA